MGPLHTLHQLWPQLRKWLISANWCWFAIVISAEHMNEGCWVSSWCHDFVKWTPFLQYSSWSHFSWGSQHFYDGMKQGNCHTNLVPFAGSYKPVVGSYDISQLWYIRKKFEMVTEPSLVSKSILDQSNYPNEDEVDEIANGIWISSYNDDWTWKTAALP